MTIASSTTKPTATTTASSETLLIENPDNHISAKVPARDSGTVTPAASVAGPRRRKTNTTAITSTIVITSVTSMSWTLARSVCVRSDSTEMSRAAGTQRFSSGSSAFTASTVSRTFASGCLVMISSTAGLPLNVACARELRGPASIVATSPSWTTVDPTTRTTIDRYDSGVRSWSLAASVKVRASPSIAPSGVTLVESAIAFLTSASDNPIVASRLGSTRTRIAG